MTAVDRSNHPEKVVLELTSSEAEHGVPWENLAAFIEHFRRALRDHHRQRRAERTKRGGHPTLRDEMVTAFRIVKLEPGSAIVELEPLEPTSAVDQETIAGAETLAVENLRSLLDSIEHAEGEVDPSVSDAISSARRALGSNGRIGVVLASGRHRSRRVVIDEEKVEELERRARRQVRRAMRISGRLHMIDVEPDRVGIRSADGVDWSCSYPEELEKTVKALIDTRVTARGVGQLQGASRGTLRLESIRPVDEFEQTELFTFERIPLEELMKRQGIRGPQGSVSIAPEDLSDDEIDAFVKALDDA